MRDWKAEIRPRLAALHLTPEREAEIVDELCQHLEDRAAHLRAAGATDVDIDRMLSEELLRTDVLAARLAALRQARQPIDGPLDSPGRSRWLAGVAVDVRVALRRFASERRVIGLAVCTLALGVASTAIMGTAVNALLLRPLAYPNADALVNVWLYRAHRVGWHFHVPPEDVDVMRASNHVFEDVAMYDTDTFSVTGTNRPQKVSVGVVSTNCFSLLGVSPAIGRDFSGADGAGTGGAATILSDRLWRERFNARPDVVGQSISLNDRPFVVIGVMAPTFDFPVGADAWLPRIRGARWDNAYVLARLRPAVSVARAQSDMAGVASAVGGGRLDPGFGYQVESLKDSVLGHSGSGWLVMLAAVGCVFAIGCVNISSLFLARGLRRRQQNAVRLSLGASRWRIIRLLLVENGILAFAAGGLALTMVPAGVRGLRAWAPANTPRLSELVVSPSALAATIGLAAIAMLAIGLFPALQAWRAEGADALRGSGTGGNTPWFRRARGGLVAVEIAMALVLLTTAALLGRSFLRLTSVDMGFRTDHVLTLSLQLPPVGYRDVARRSEFLERAVAAIGRVPGVTAAAASSGSVMRGWGLPGAPRTPAQRLTIDGRSADDHPPEADMRRVDPEFFKTLGMRLIGGRAFNRADRIGSEQVAIVNETMARAFWGEASPVGMRLAFRERTASPSWFTVVGIVGDTRDVTPTQAPRPEFYIPILQDSDGLDLDSLTLFARTSGDPLSLADDARQAVWGIDASLPIADVSTIELAADGYVDSPRFRAALVAAVALLGLMLALTGIYAVISFAVEQRMTELSLRVVLGADSSAIVHLVMIEALRWTCVGIAFGLAGAVSIAGALQAQLFEVEAVDPITLGTTALFVTIIAAAAAYGPARRAAATDPLVLLRGGGAAAG